MYPALSDISQSLRYNGYACLERFSPDLSTLELARKVGSTEEIAGVPLVQKIIPREEMRAPRNVYSGNYGLGAFPLHTDLAHWHVPPRYMILRCITPAPQVFTRVVDFTRCLAGVSEGTIQRAQFVPRRKLSGKKHLLRLCQRIADHHLWRWDELFIIPANSEAIEIRNHLSSAMAKCGGATISFLHYADTLIIDNWRMLHGRSPVPTTDLSRVVERVYLWEINV
jgi:L-asparagine oxygenase